MQESIVKEHISKSTGPCQEDTLLSYYHRLHQGRQVADLPGKILLRKEARRVRQKILFTESLEGYYG